MSIHDIGPGIQSDYPRARKTSSWSDDYGTRGFVERDRPYIDDQPAHRHGWEAPSRWGTRPVQSLEGEFERGRESSRGFLGRAWTWARNAGRVAARGVSREL